MRRDTRPNKGNISPRNTDRRRSVDLNTGSYRKSGRISQPIGSNSQRTERSPQRSSNINRHDPHPHNGRQGRAAQTARQSGQSTSRSTGNPKRTSQRNVSSSRNTARSSQNLRGHSYKSGQLNEQNQTRSNRHSVSYNEYRNDRDRPAAQLYAGPAKRKGSASSRIVEGIVSIFSFIVSSIGRGASFVWNKSKALSVIIVVVAMLSIGVGIDSIITSGKIYQGVSIGSIDLSNKTVDEAKSEIESTYTNKLFSTQTFIFEDDATLDSIIMDRNDIDLEKLTNLVESEETNDSHTIWLADAITLGAELPSAELAKRAYEVGRGSGVFDRLGAFFSGYNIEPYANYNEILLNNMIKDIESSTGDPLVNWGVTINEGACSLSEGHDGYEIEKDSFIKKLNELFFESQEDVHAYAVNMPYSEVKIDQKAAQSTSDAINEAISMGSSFVYEGNNIQIDTPTLGSWVTTSIEKVGDKYILAPAINEDMATTSLVKLLNPGSAGYNVNVSIYEQDGEYIVKPDNPIVIPSATNALNELDHALFEPYRKTGTYSNDNTQFNIPVNSEDYDGTFSVEDALAYGVIEVFSSYTTNYSTKASNANRIYNIHLVADLLNDSIIGAHGGTWSFNEIAGNTTEEAGFREAGSIIENERSDSIGGGICQVATTVFNAVYNSGLQINQRHNHSLYMSAYPDGRDAAVSYPLLDLVWQNDTDSDIILTTSYTESSVTVNLIGVNPKLTVETEVGDWEKGEKYTTKIEVDENMANGTYSLETKGSDGKVIEVKRTVKDENGYVVRERTFVSIYSPVNQIVKVGPETDTAEVLAKFERKDKTDSASSESSGTSSKSSGSSTSSSGTTNTSTNTSSKSSSASKSSSGSSSSSTGSSA